MNAWWKIGLILAAATLVWGCGWKVRGWRDDAALEVQEKAALAEMNRLHQQAADDAAAYEDERVRNSIAINKLNKQMEVYREKNHIPADCFIPADGLRAIAAAIKAGSPG